VSNYYARKIYLERLVKSAGDGKRWSAAARFQRSIVDLVRSDEILTEPQRRKVLPGELNSLARYELHAKHFAGALAASEEAHGLDPANAWIDSNRAHALLLLGRTDEAMRVYQAHIGKKLGNRSWEDVIVEDWRSLEATGITHPDVERVRQLVNKTAAR
jgi:hypothetical protein